MSEPRKTRSSVAAPERAAETTATDNDQKFSQSNDTTKQEREQAGFVSRLLSPGKANAIPGRELVKLLNLKDLRELTQLVEQERKDGSPICAATDSGAAGYFLADSPDELERYIISLDRRLHNIGQTRRHLENTLDRMTGQQKIGGDWVEQGNRFSDHAWNDGGADTGPVATRYPAGGDRGRR